MHGRVKLTSKDPRHDAKLYVETLTARLRSLNPGPIDARELDVAVRGDLFRLSWTWFHPFKGISSARFRVVPERDQFWIDYEIQLTAVLRILAVVAVMVFAYSLKFPHTLWNLAGPPVCVVFVGFLNAGFAHVRIRELLKDVGRTMFRPGTRAG